MYVHMSIHTYVWVIYYYYMLPCKSHLIHLQLGTALWANKFTTNCVHSSNKLLLTNVATHTHEQILHSVTHSVPHWVPHAADHPLLLLLQLLPALLAPALLGFLAALHIFVTKILTVSKLGDLIWIYGAMRSGSFCFWVLLQLPRVLLGYYFAQTPLNTECRF